MLEVAYSAIYKYRLPEGHRFPMIKYELLPEQLIREGTISESQLFQPSRLTIPDLLKTHTQAYLDKLHTLPLERKEERAIGFPVRDDLVERGKYIASGTYECALKAMDHRIAMNIAGGTHHAFADHGEGFCVFNDIAIASNLLLDKKLADRILVIDLDVHQGNGTAHLFREEHRVYTFSMHGERNYPLRKQNSDLDIGLPDKCDDRFYLQMLQHHLPSLLDTVEPDFVFYLSGVDVLASDKLGRLSLTREGCKQRDEMVLRLCHQHKLPVAISMGGGYSERIKDIIEAHANTFRVAQEMYF